MAKTRSDGGGKGRPKGVTRKYEPKSKGSGPDIGKFASEVSRNYAKGVKQAGAALDKAIGSRPASNTVSRAMKTAPQARAGLKRALGK